MSTNDMSWFDQSAEIRSGKRPLRAAIVQMEAVHEEVVDSVVTMLRGNGIEASVFLNSKILGKGDLFARYTDYGDRVHYLDLTTADDWDALTEAVRGFDLLVMNTFQRDGQAQWVRRLGLPTIGIVHNPSMLTRQYHCLDVVHSGQVTLATLAPHVTSWMLAQRPRLFAHTATLDAWMWELPEAYRLPATSRRRLTVPGGVDFDKRDYGLILDALPDLVSKLGRDAFEVAVIGGGKDRAELEARVAASGYGDMFVFAPLEPESGLVSSDTFYPELERSDLLLPLLPEQKRDYRVYKITAAVSSSVGYGVPAVLDSWTARVYDLPSVRYPLGQLRSGIDRALSMSADDLADVTERLAERRTRVIAESTAEMGQALSTLGLVPEGLEPREEVLGRAGLEQLGERLDPEWAEYDRDDEEAFLRFAAEIFSASHSQRFQDVWALWESGFVRSGYFVEFGALNGKHFSNTYLLEQLGWKGVVAEPHPDFERAMRANRSCTISTKCVYDRSGETVTFHAVRGRPALSTVRGFGEDDARKHLREEFVAHEVETVTLHDLLLEAGAPEVVDFLSIDTEGSELLILGAFDFDKQPIRLICVEHNDEHREALYDLLTSKGYTRKWPHLSGHDDWYVLESAYSEWSTQDYGTVTEAAGEIEPFDRLVKERRSLLDSFRKVEPRPNFSQFVEREEADTLGTSADPTYAEALYRFGTQFYGALEGATGATPDERNARLSGAFRRICSSLAPTLSLELGAVEGTFSRDIRTSAPECRLVAYATEDMDESHRAELEADGVEVRRPIVAPAVPADAEIADLDSERIVARIGVEAARVEVLWSAELVLRRALAVYVEVEQPSEPKREESDAAIAGYFLRRGFVLMGRGRGESGRITLVFVNQCMAARPIVAKQAARVIGPSREQRSANERRQVERLRGKLDRQRGRVARLERRLQAMESSRSWRLTRPLRTVVEGLGRRPTRDGVDQPPS